MSRGSSGSRLFLPLNANIVDLSYEPGLALRTRIVELAPSFTPGEVSRQTDVVFIGVRELEISLELGINPCVSRVSKWATHGKRRSGNSPGSKTGVSIKTSTGSINVACDSIRKLRLRDIPVMPTS